VRDRSRAAITLPSDAARRKAREIVQQSFKNGRQVAVQIWRPLADGNIQFAVRYFVVPERNAKPRITAIAAKPSRVSAGACPLRDIPRHSEGANELPSTPISDFQKFKPCGSGGSLGYRPGNANRT